MHLCIHVNIDSLLQIVGDVANYWDVIEFLGSLEYVLLIYRHFGCPCGRGGFKLWNTLSLCLSNRYDKEQAESLEEKIWPNLARLLIFFLGVIFVCLIIRKTLAASQSAHKFDIDPVAGDTSTHRTHKSEAYLHIYVTWYFLSIVLYFEADKSYSVKFLAMEDLRLSTRGILGRTFGTFACVPCYVFTFTSTAIL